MARQKRRSQLDSIDEINMTPLIDLTFLLLIIFMVTTPLLENAVNVSPPEMNADDIVDDDNNRSVTLDKDGNIVYEKITISKESLLKKLNALYGVNKKVNLFVRADGDQPYKRVMNLMKTVKSAGFTNVFLITRAE